MEGLIKTVVAPQSPSFLWFHYILAAMVSSVLSSLVCVLCVILLPPVWGELYFIIFSAGLEPLGLPSYAVSHVKLTSFSRDSFHFSLVSLVLYSCLSLYVNAHLKESAWVPGHIIQSLLLLFSTQPYVSHVTAFSCHSYWDNNGDHHDSEECFSSYYCCGSCTKRYCCKKVSLVLTQELCPNRCAFISIYVTPF